jgi:shikimate dehydrogenase
MSDCENAASGIKVPCELEMSENRIPKVGFVEVPGQRSFSLGLVGWPVAHSLSPRLHTTALQVCGFPGIYKLYPIQPGSEANKGLQTLILQMHQEALDGLNVTIPHKESVISFLDQLTTVATAIGAVNTIYRQDGQLIGDNTDAPGFLADLEQLTLEGPRCALVMGAGGAARAIAFALAEQGWDLYITARRIAQASHLAMGLQKQINKKGLTIAPIEFEEQFLRRVMLSCGLLVNATPVGMAPHVDESPLPEGLNFPKGMAVYDLVYNPLETALIRSARAAGLQAVAGLGMLVEQAALSFERWTGVPAPREQMRAVVEETT